LSEANLRAGEPDDRMVVGLGNPGPAYERTRHNAGWRAVSAIAETRGEEPWRREDQLEYRWARWGAAMVYLVRPLTFMNQSGPAVAGFARTRSAPVSRVLVIHDDLDLPVGCLRFRRAGSSGGHRGVASLIAAFEEVAFARLKIGVGRPLEDAVDFVLGDPSAEEAATLAAAEETAAEAAWVWATSGIEVCMNRFNRKAVGEEGKH
jgi:PTH1 family peptidyl-tRNA hydrolase